MFYNDDAEGHYIYFGGGGFFFFDSQNKLVGSDVTSILMRCTDQRLKDQYLYEGDVIRQEESEEQFDVINWYVVTWIKEWCMFGCLHIGEEYHQYMENGIEELDEASFWTFPLNMEEKYCKKFLCGNIYENPELLKK